MRARRAVDAIDHVEQKVPDIIFSSLVFGDMNGFELCRRLRSMPETSTSTIVAFTGYFEPHIEKDAAAAGFDHYLLKPVYLEKVLNLLETCPREGRYRSPSLQVHDIQVENVAEASSFACFSPNATP